MAQTRQLDGILHQRPTSICALLNAAFFCVTRAARRTCSTVPISRWVSSSMTLIELTTLRFGNIALLQRFKVKADGGDRGLQLVRDGVEKAVLLLVAADFAHQEDGVQDDAGDDESEEQDAQDEGNDFAPVEHDPTDIEHQRYNGDEHAERNGEMRSFFCGW